MSTYMYDHQIINIIQAIGVIVVFFRFISTHQSNFYIHDITSHNLKSVVYIQQIQNVLVSTICLCNTIFWKVLVGSLTMVTHLLKNTVCIEIAPHKKFECMKWIRPINALLFSCRVGRSNAIES